MGARKGRRFPAALHLLSGIVQLDDRDAQVRLRPRPGTPHPGWGGPVGSSARSAPPLCPEQSMRCLHHPAREPESVRHPAQLTGIASSVGGVCVPAFTGAPSPPGTPSPTGGWVASWGKAVEPARPSRAILRGILFRTSSSEHPPREFCASAPRIEGYPNNDLRASLRQGVSVTFV
jgi:hypothetical protein